jgi:hypothetical protein
MSTDELAPLGGNPLCANVAIARAFYDPEDDREFAIQVVDAGWKGDGPRRSRSPHTALRCRRCCRPIAGRGNRGLRWGTGRGERGALQSPSSGSPPAGQSRHRSRNDAILSHINRGE